MLRVMHFADLINKDDFIDIIIQQASRAEFRFFACTRTSRSNIATPDCLPDVRRFVIPGLSRGNIPVAALCLAVLLRRFKIDILHTHHYDPAVIGWLATRLNQRTNFVIGRHYSDAIYQLSGGIRKSILLGIEARTNSAADRIIVPSGMIRQLLVEQGVDCAKIEVVHYAFSPDKWREAEGADRAALRASLGLEGVVFGQFGRMDFPKGYSYLLKAVAKLRPLLPDFKVILVGDGPMRAEIEREIGRLDLRESIRLIGWRTDALKIMAAVDVVVHPTLMEAFSQTMIEALYLKKPLIMTSVSGAIDIIDNGVNGLLIPPRDSDALAEAMQRLAADPTLRIKLGEAGHHYVECNLLAERVIPQYEQIYRSLAH